MTVRELIRKLEEFSGDANVYLSSQDDEETGIDPLDAEDVYSADRVKIWWNKGKSSTEFLFKTGSIKTTRESCHESILGREAWYKTVLRARRTGPAVLLSKDIEPLVGDRDRVQKKART